MQTTRCRITMGKKNDFEASDNSVKKEAWPNRVPLTIEMARLLHDN
jgi:hypothetical protein